jgi:hypothetical protein
MRCCCCCWLLVLLQLRLYSSLQLELSFAPLCLLLCRLQTACMVRLWPEEFVSCLVLFWSCGKPWGICAPLCAQGPIPGGATQQSRPLGGSESPECPEHDHTNGICDHDRTHAAAGTKEKMLRSVIVLSIFRVQNQGAVCNLSSRLWVSLQNPWQSVQSEFEDEDAVAI